MPNPLYLKIMDTKLWEYNSLTPDEKAEFQDEARMKLADLHESDIDAYCKLTEAQDEPAPETTSKRRKSR